MITKKIQLVLREMLLFIDNTAVNSNINDEYRIEVIDIIKGQIESLSSGDDNEKLELYKTKLYECFSRLEKLSKNLDKSIEFPGCYDLNAGNDESTDKFIKIIKDEINN
jgi:hypothetical protein